MSDDTDDILRDIRRWVKIIGIQEAKPVLEDALTTDDPEKEEKLRLTYHLTNGENSTRDIAKIVDWHYATISKKQSEWAEMGIVDRANSSESYSHVISLDEAGIEVPDIPEPDEQGGE